MIKKILGSLFLLLFLVNYSQGQNLIPNNSFEEIKMCPNDYTMPYQQIKTKVWYSPTSGTPDVFAACGGPKVSTPKNYVGFAYPVDGDNYVGLFAGKPNQSDSSCYREYLTCKLKANLKKGRKYLFSFYARPSSLSKYKLDELSFTFTKESPGSSSDQILKNIPFLTAKADSLKEKDEWEHFSYEFTATGNENYLTIGNFFPPTNSNKTKYKTRENVKGGWITYYLYDEFVLHEESIQPLNNYELNEPFSISSVYFDFDSSVPYNEAQNGLSGLINYLLQNPELRLIINGYTDNMGPEIYNQNLSVERARSIKTIIVNSGIDSLRIETHGFGYKNMISNKDSLNRRTEFVLTKKVKK